MLGYKCASGRRKSKLQYKKMESKDLNRLHSISAAIEETRKKVNRCLKVCILSASSRNVPKSFKPLLKDTARVNIYLFTPWTSDVNWAYIARSEEVWTSAMCNQFPSCTEGGEQNSIINVQQGPKQLSEIYSKILLR